jgi:hypothetical protein
MRRQLIGEGMIGGTIGAVTVAGWFLLVDTARGHPFWTPSLLAATLLDGVRDAQTLHITARLVLEYTVFHVAAFLLFGLLAAALMAASDRDPRLLSLVIMLFCCFEVFALALISILAEWLFEVLAWWTVVTANLLAALTMLAFFVDRHRGAFRRVLRLSDWDT